MAYDTHYKNSISDLSGIVISSGNLKNAMKDNGPKQHNNHNFSMMTRDHFYM